MGPGRGGAPFSPGGDGTAVLGPVLREYMVAEATRAPGIPMSTARAHFPSTVRALAEALRDHRTPLPRLFDGADAIDAWTDRWAARLDAEGAEPSRRAPRAGAPATLGKPGTRGEAADGAVVEASTRA